MNPLIEYQRLLAIAQSGKKFGRDHFDQERYAPARESCKRIGRRNGL